MGGELTGATAGRSGAPIRVGIAGSTGSIGTQTLDVVRAENARCPGSYQVTSLGAGRSVADVVAQAKEFSPEVVVVTDPEARREVAAALPSMTVSDDIADVVEPADVVVNGVVGFAGLPVTISTVSRESSAYPDAHHCPAPSQGNVCGECRACWDRGTAHVDYHYH